MIFEFHISLICIGIGLVNKEWEIFFGE